MELNKQVTFDVLGGTSFTIAVHLLETIRTVKERVQSIHHIPISDQTFIFNGEILRDHLRVLDSHPYSQINHGSRISLVVTLPSPRLPMPRIRPLWIPPPPPLNPKFLSSSHQIPSKIKKLEESSQQFLSSQSIQIIYDLFGNSKRSPVLEWEHWGTNISQPEPWRVMLSVKVPEWKDRIPIEADFDGTVWMLKERILGFIGILVGEDLRSLPLQRIVLQTHSTTKELLDHQLLHDSAVSEDHEIDAFIMKSYLPLIGTKLKVKVSPMRTTEKIEIEVNAEDKVSVLRVDLEKLHQTLRFRLPADGSYVFVHKHQHMIEDNSFRWHQVRHGDTIETFDDCISDTESSTH